MAYSLELEVVELGGFNDIRISTSRAHTDTHRHPAEELLDLPCFVRQQGLNMRLYHRLWRSYILAYMVSAWAPPTFLMYVPSTQAPRRARLSFAH